MARRRVSVAANGSQVRQRASSMRALLCAGAMVAASCTTGATAPASPAPSGGAHASGSLLSPPLQNATLALDRAAQASIGRAGGTLGMTDDRGVRYSLEVPPGALTSDLAITAIPIVSMSGLPGRAAVAAGVHFVPEGLAFRLPAMLVIELPSPPAGGVIAMAYAADVAAPRLHPGIATDGRVELPVPHFSGYALLQSTDAAIAAADLQLELPWAPSAGPADQALAEIAAALNDGSAAAANTALRGWLEAELRPLVAAFQNVPAWSLDDAQYLERSAAVLNSFALWHYLTKLMVLSGLPAEPQLAPEIEGLQVTAARHAIRLANEGCGARTSAINWLAMADMFAFQAWVVPTGQIVEDLALAAVQRDACVQVVFDPVEGVAFPDAIQPGQAGTLDVKAGISVDGGPPRYDTLLNLTILPHGTDPADLIGATTSPTGSYQATYRWLPDAAELRIDLEACMFGLPLCQVAFVVRGMPAESCPQFSLTANGVTEETDKFDGVSMNQGDAGGAIGGEMTFSLAAFDGAHVSARGKLHYSVDASQAGTSTFEVAAIMAVAWENYTGGAATVTMTVDGTAKAFAIPADGPRDGVDRLRFPLVLEHGQSFEVDLMAEAEAGSDRSVGVTGTLTFLLGTGMHPADHSLYINEQTCA